MLVVIGHHGRDESKHPRDSMPIPLEPFRLGGREETEFREEAPKHFVGEQAC